MNYRHYDPHPDRPVGCIGFLIGRFIRYTVEMIGLAILIGAFFLVMAVLATVGNCLGGL